MNNILKIMSAGCILFFAAPAASQTHVVTLKACSEVVTKSDPSIVTQTIIDARFACGAGHPVKVQVIDQHFGFATAIKSVQNVPISTRKTEPSIQDVYVTHQPCRVTYQHEDGIYEGVMIEWLIAKHEVCGGRPAGSYYRVYTWDNQICLRPAGGCIPVHQLSELGQRRFSEVLKFAFSHPVAMR